MELQNYRTSSGILSITTATLLGAILRAQYGMCTTTSYALAAFGDYKKQSMSYSFQDQVHMHFSIGSVLIGVPLLRALVSASGIDPFPVPYSSSFVEPVPPLLVNEFKANYMQVKRL